jgi:hypothetical protein
VAVYCQGYGRQAGLAVQDAPLLALGSRLNELITSDWEGRTCGSSSPGRTFHAMLGPAIQPVSRQHASLPVIGWLQRPRTFVAWDLAYDAGWSEWNA